MSLLYLYDDMKAGLVAVVATPLITLLMICFKKIIPYELRKGLHYLFYVFAIGLCFHVPPSAFPNGGFIAFVLGFSICLYTLDRIYIIFMMTERIDTSKFEVLQSGVSMTMSVSDRFLKNLEKGGFGYVCLPWIDRQWHAFSLFQDPNDPSKRVVFILNVGDWTSKVHSELLRNNTSRPVWIQGPFDTARDFDNQILVATGIGITPALSTIEAHKDSRSIFLIWMTRDESMIEFFLDRYHYLDHQFGFNFIFYTGKTPLSATLLEGLPANVEIIQSRPDLETLIPDIIHANECDGEQIETNFQPCHKQVIREILEKTEEYEDVEHFNESLQCSSNERYQELVTIAKDAGYQFSDLSHHLREAGIPCPFTVEGTKRTKRRGSLSRILPNLPQTDVDPNLIMKRVRHLAGIWKPNMHAKRSIKQMDQRASQLSRWGIMYCGASSQVKDTLKSLSDEYEISMHYESFAW